MLADEFTQVLLRLGILHETTLPYSPYQNGKQECFWGHLEGRLTLSHRRIDHVARRIDNSLFGT